MEAQIDGFYKVCVKLYATENTIENDAAVFVPIFHDWIREGALDLVMLDVADYAHAPQSPGIMLVCHEVSFSLDRTDGRFGLLAQRRTPVEGPPEEAVRRTLADLLRVGVKLESDPRVHGRLTLNASTIRVEANDRLRLPNSDSGYRIFAPAVAAGVAAVFGGGEPDLSRVENDPRDRLAVEVRLEDVPTVAEVLAGLTPVVPQGSV